MSNTDKTRQKLVNSMRRSKEAAATGPVPKTAAAKTASTRQKRAKTKGPTATAARKKSIPDRGATAKTRVAAVGSRRVSADPYQSAGRVWPD
jgi:hypothetical protein